ncbi:MAG: DUF2188 domain-containing protein [Acidimicrobiia bacterium]|nr:DUF2188 domain-containing protein [Acidimicrobiia bacterium]MCY4435340.1 DUF2188 domain-containing protein [bacterium]
MGKKPEVFTVRHGDRWANRRAGSDRVSRTYQTKQEAQEAGRKTAQRERTEHIIQNRDGKISQRNSYGNDPHPPKG